MPGPGGPRFPVHQWTPPWCEHVPLRFWEKLQDPSAHTAVAPAALAAAYGSAADCAQRVLRQFDLGVDGVIMHGATPKELAQVVHAYRDLRPAGRFDRLAANPGIAAQPAS